MIDIEYCSSYDKSTLVEISAGFDGSEGGSKWPIKSKNFSLVLDNSYLLPQKPK